MTTTIQHTMKTSLLILLLVLTISGCSSYGAARLQSMPAGAEVINLEDDSLLGTTPVIIHWKNNREESKMITVRFRKLGYDEKVTAFWVNMRHGSRTDAEKNAQPVKIELKRKK